MKGLNDDEICDFVALTEDKVTSTLLVSYGLTSDLFVFSLWMCGSLNTCRLMEINGV